MAEAVDYKKVTVSGLIWKLLEQIGSKLIAFILSVILARLLFPEDYGVIALTTVFITLCDVFVNSGFATSLIQKKDTDELDYSSVFYTSMVMAILLYAMIFFLSPKISEWFETPILVNVLRVLALRVPISAYGSVQQAYATKNYMFKKFFIASLIGTSISGIIGIVMAYKGFGVWALVAQNLTEIIINKITLFYVTRWRPHLCYSWARTKKLFGYGWKILACSLFETICNDVNSLVIGKRYSTEDLAYTNKGSSLPKMMGQFAINPIRFVLMPVLSAKQGSKNMNHTISNCIRVCSYIVFPMMCGLVIISPTLVPFLFTDKWSGCIIFMQLMCIYYMFDPLITINTILIQAHGNSSLYLIISVIARLIGVIGLLIVINYGVFWIVITQLITIIIHFIIVSIPIGKLYGYTFLKEIKDIFPQIIITIIMAVIVYFINDVPIHPMLVLSLQCISGVFIYLLLSIILKVPAFKYIMNTLKSFLSKRK